MANDAFLSNVVLSESAGGAFEPNDELPKEEDAFPPNEDLPNVEDGVCMLKVEDGVFMPKVEGGVFMPKVEDGASVSNDELRKAEGEASSEVVISAVRGRESANANDSAELVLTWGNCAAETFVS